MSQQSLNKLISPPVQLASSVLSVNGATGFAGAQACVIPEVTGADYIFEANVGPLSGAFGATGYYDVATLQVLSHPTSSGITQANGLPVTLKGHGVTGANFVAIKNTDANTQVRFAAQGDYGVTGGVDMSPYLSVAVKGLTGSVNVSVAVASVSKGSYNTPQ